MIISARQEIIVDHIVQHGPSQTNELLKAVNNKSKNVSRLTAIRDVNALLANGSLTSSGENRNRRYGLSPSFRLLKPISVPKYFSRAADERNARKSFNHSVFNSLKFDLLNKQEKDTVNAVSEQMKEKLEAFKDNSLLKKREYERIIIDFSWKSSEIEGNTYSLLETEALIKDHRSAKGKTKEETAMIIGHKDAFNLILKHTSMFKDISRGNIEEIHKVLVSKLKLHTGYRALPVGITGTAYRPLSVPQQIKEAIDRTAELVNDRKNPVEKAIISVAMLSYIQGFEDGNKRTARMVSNGLLVAHGLLPISYRSVDPTEYKKAMLLFYEQNNISYLKKIFIDQFRHAANNYF